MKSHKFGWGKGDVGEDFAFLFRLGVRGGRGLHRIRVSLRSREAAILSRVNDGAPSLLGLESRLFERYD